MYKVDRWRALRWQSNTRYYTAEIIQDLFGCWVIRCGWGGLHNRHGNFQEELLSSYDEALTELQKVGKRRLHRGYRLV